MSAQSAGDVADESQAQSAPIAFAGGAEAEVAALVEQADGYARAVVADGEHHLVGVDPGPQVDSAGLAGIGWRLAKPFFASPEKGARTTLFLATVPDPTPYHGAYLIDSKPAQPDTPARDDALAELLWVESARLVGL